MFFDETKCAHCGKVFCIPFRDRWAYKCTVQNNCIKYFCKYTCMLRFKEEHTTKKKPKEGNNRSEPKENKWYQDNRDTAIERAKAYYHAHKDEPEFKQKRKDSFRRWRENNREYWNEYQKNYSRKKKMEVSNETI